jgi:hypothetical protein
MATISPQETVARLRRARRRAEAELIGAVLLMGAGALELLAEPLAGLTLVAVAALAAGLVLCGIAESRLERVKGAERSARVLAAGWRRPEEMAWLHAGAQQGGPTGADAYGGGWYGTGGGSDCGASDGGGDCGGG